MRYLHGTAIGVHGALSSGCCFIDGRWTLQIGDVGVQWLKKIGTDQTKTENKGTTKVFNERFKCINLTMFLFFFLGHLLWTAPELLRGGGREGTKNGDVYSFAIILQEILLRAHPFALNMEPVDGG